jgi:hypothetical protein
MTEKVSLDKLYGSPLPSTRTGMFYNAFAYPTKISPETIAVYIATHTKPNDTVLDVFGGSGSTGLAALMCEHPTAQMKPFVLLCFRRDIKKHTLDFLLFNATKFIFKFICTCEISKFF